jgi:hypothetical protein
MVKIKWKEKKIEERGVREKKILGKNRKDF